ncbi:MAG: type I polyketide synthase, partial [Planctomycetota bacterium]
QCLQLATGRLADVLGPEFAAVDAFPTRVRLPAEPLMLVDRIIALEGEPRSMGSGRVVTEHDVRPGDWYLDAGVMPTAIAVESGQADLFLSGWLGIDFHTRGAAVYRLLDATVVFHDHLPPAGSVVRYDIRIHGFFHQGETRLFRFGFEATWRGADSQDWRPLLSMRAGIAGFFTPAELAAGRGVVIPSKLRQAEPGRVSPDHRPLVPIEQVEAYGDAQLDALRAGDLAACFGPAFAGANPQRLPCLPGERLRLVHRIRHLDPRGGRHGLGLCVGEADIHPDDWFLTCHFHDDMVMPGTLMYECCLHTLRVHLLRLGWVPLDAPVVYEPVPGIASTLKCRGQVLPSTRQVHYELTIKSIGYDEAGTPQVVADALMYGDGQPIVHMLDMSLRLRGLTRDALEAHWQGRQQGATAAAPADAPRPGLPPRPAVVNEEGIAFDQASITAFAIGDPSAAFGSRYRVFDRERVIARLPGPPYQFLDRIVAIADCRQWVMQAGGRIEAEYDVPPDAWYFSADGQDARQQPALMPYCVLLEAALQPCGWLSSYVGSVLTSDEDLSYRNLGGTAVQHRPVTPDIGTLRTAVHMTGSSMSGGMIIQQFTFAMHCADGPVYTGSTMFGFFTKAALAQQIGIRDAAPHHPDASEQQRALASPYPGGGPFPAESLRMLTRIDAYIPDGGPHGLGFISGSLDVDPGAWYFRAHFHQDPVTPGSLGLESFLQLLRVWAVERWGASRTPVLQAPALQEEHSWLYRGQVLPTDRQVQVQALVTTVDDASRTVHADGWLGVDGRTIYRMIGFALRYA